MLLLTLKTVLNIVWIREPEPEQDPKDFQGGTGTTTNQQIITAPQHRVYVCTYLPTLL
jgi:hypothetical protein